MESNLSKEHRRRARLATMPPEKRKFLEDKRKQNRADFKRDKSDHDENILSWCDDGGAWKDTEVDYHG